MANLKTLRTTKNEVHSEPHAIATENEMSLTHFWLILAHHKQIIVAGLLLGVVFAMAFALFIPDKYRFYTTIALGQLAIQNTGETEILPIDSPKTALAKLESSYFPQALEQALANDQNTSGYKLQANSPKDSNLVIIETIGTLQNKVAYLQIISNAAQALIQDHNNILAPIEVARTAKLERAMLKLKTIRDTQVFAAKIDVLKQKIVDTKRKLSAIKDQRKIIESRYKNIDMEDELTKKQYQDNESTLNTALKNRATIIKQNDNPATAVTLLMLGSEIQHYQNHMAALAQRLNIGLPEKREHLKKQLKDNARTQQQQIDLVSSYKTELEIMHIDRTRQENIQMLAIKELKEHSSFTLPTRILRQASTSTTAIGSSTTVKIAVGLMLGLMLGLFGVFVLEFLAKVSRLREKYTQTGKYKTELGNNA